MLTGVTKNSVLFADVLALIGIGGSLISPSIAMNIYTAIVCLIAGILNGSMAWDLYWKSKGHTE